MARKHTAKRTRQLVEELLDLIPAFERYRELEKEIKAALTSLKFQEMNIEEKGRVFISTSERVTVPPDLVRQTLPPALAEKAIQTKESVSNDIIKALVTLGEIKEEQRQKLLDGATKTPVTSMHVRPLK